MSATEVATIESGVPGLLFTPTQVRQAAYLKDHPELLAALTPVGLDNGYICDTPMPKQWAAMCFSGEELLYGGAKGGGKSRVLLMAAFQYAHVRGYKALLMRRTYQMCIKPDGIQTRLVEYLRRLGMEKCWMETKRQALLPSGAIIEVGYAEEEKDAWNYDGIEYQYIGIDQIEQFTPPQFLQMQTCLRRPTCPTHSQVYTPGCPVCDAAGPLLGVPLRVWGTANPRGPWKNWYRNHFIKSKPPLVNGVPQRMFIPALARENYYIDRDSYERRFANTDALTRKQLWDGDWDAEGSGQMFSRGWFRVVADATDIVCRGRAWDRGAGTGERHDWTVGALGGVTRDGRFVMLDEIRVKLPAHEVERLMLDTALADGAECYIFGQQDPGAAGKGEAQRMQEVLAGYNYEIETTPIGSRGPNGETGKGLRARPFAVAAGSGRVDILERAWNDRTLAELEAFDPCGKNAEDNAVDSWSLAWRRLCGQTGETWATVEGLDDRDDGQMLLEEELLDVGY